MANKVGATPKETAAEIRFGRGLELVKKSLKHEEPPTQVFYGLIELNRAAPGIAGRMDGAVEELKKIDGIFLDLPADNYEASGLLRLGRDEGLVPQEKALAVQEFLAARERAAAETSVPVKAAFAPRLLESKSKFLQGARAAEASRAAAVIDASLAGMSRFFEGSVGRLSAENEIARQLDALLSLKIGDFIAFPPLAQPSAAKTPAAPTAKPQPAPVAAPPLAKPVKSPLAQPAKKPEPPVARAPLVSPAKKPQAAPAPVIGPPPVKQVKAPLAQPAPAAAAQPAKPAAASATDNRAAAQRLIVHIEALYKRFIGILDGGEAEKRDEIVSAMLPYIESINAQYAVMKKIVGSAKQHSSSPKKKNS